MRRPQHTLTAAAVEYLSTQLLAPLLGVWPAVRTCTLDVVLAVLAYAAARITSVTDACARRGGVVHRIPTVRHWLICGDSGDGFRGFAAGLGWSRHATSTHFRQKTTRMPKLSPMAPGSAAYPLAARQFSASVFQQPPRRTRLMCLPLWHSGSTIGERP